MEERLRPRRTSGDKHVYRQDFLDSSQRRVALTENTATDAARSHGDHDLRIGRRAERLEQSQLHVPGYWSRYQKHIRVARRGHEVDAKALDIVDRVVQSNDFEFASVAGARIHLPDRQ